MTALIGRVLIPGTFLFFSVVSGGCNCGHYDGGLITVTQVLFDRGDAFVGVRGHFSYPKECDDTWHTSVAVAVEIETGEVTIAEKNGPSRKDVYLA